MITPLFRRLLSPLLLLLLAGCSEGTGPEIDDLDWVDATVIVPGARWAYTDLAIVDPSTIILSGDHHLIRTSDGGTTWNEVFADTTLEIGDLSRSCNGTIFSVARSSEEEEPMVIILRSRDEGRTWEQVYKKEIYAVINSVECREDGTVISGFNVMTLRSEDEGSSWVEDSTIYRFGSGSVHLIDTAESLMTGVYLDAQPVLLHRSGSGDLSHIVLPKEIRAFLAIAPITRDLHVASLTNGIYRSTDRGVTWSTLSDSPKRIFGLHFLDSLNGIAVGEGDWPSFKIASTGLPFGSLFRTTDGGRTWEGTMRFTGVWEFTDVECLDRSPCFAITSSHLVRLDLTP